ncbi:MAG: LCP family protein [Actinomycetota bacterium]
MTDPTAGDGDGGAEPARRRRRAEPRDTSAPADWVPLPSAGTGRRHRRRREREQQRRRQRMTVLALLVVIISLIGTAIVIRPLLGDGDDEPTEVAAAEPVAVTLEATPKALLIHVGDIGELVSVTAAVLDGSGAGGGMVFVPASTVLDVPGFGLEPLSRSLELGGEELVQLTTENLLGVEFDHVAVLDARAWTTLVEDVAPLEVVNPNPIDRDDDGRIAVVTDAGPLTLTADAVGPFLAAQALDEPDLVRLLRHDTVWRAWLGGLATVDYPIADVRTDLVAFLHGLADGPVDYRLLPVETLAGTGVDTEYKIVRDEIDALVAEFAPDAAGDGSGRIRVQLLNGAGTPGLASVATEILLPAGARVDLRDNARTFDYRTTQLVYYRDDQRNAAEQLRDALGLGEVVRDRNAIDVVDVTIVLGRDFVAQYVDGQ